MKARQVRILLEVVAMTDREPWEWGEGLAKFLEGEIDNGEPTFGPVTVRCDDADYVEEPR